MGVNMPLSVQDFAQCREEPGSYLENPQKSHDEFECLTLSFLLTWRDIMFILTQLCLQ